MTKQVLSALAVLMILIISQLIWFNQLWEIDKKRYKDEVSANLSSVVKYHCLASSSKKDSKNNYVTPMTMIEVEDKNDTLKSDIVITNNYDSEKNPGDLVENVFADLALKANRFHINFIDSVFRKSYPRIKEVSYYSLKLYKNNRSIDSVSYGKKSLTSPFKIDIPLGSKKTYHIKADFNLKPSAQVRNMLFSIGITSVAIILVAVFIIFQLLLLRKRTLQLQWREKSVSGIIHDLKSPLSYVYTMLGFFESTEKETVKKQNLSTAKTRVKHLSEKIELLLPVFNAGNNKLVMNKTTYHFTERCTELMEELKLIYKDKIINYHILAPADFTLNVDNTYFEGCIRNLLDNAVKYSPVNVEITVSSSVKDNKVFLSFNDNGPGVPVNLQKKVFKEFYRNSESGDVKGHGIGLSFTKQIVEAHKGKIYIQNNNQTGTTFVIELPTFSPLKG